MEMDAMGVDEKLRPKESKCRISGSGGGWGLMRLWTSITRLDIYSSNS